MNLSPHPMPPEADVPRREPPELSGRLSWPASLAALLLSLPLVTGCASGKVRGEPPFAQLSNWKIDGQSLSQDLRLRNVNDEAMELQSIRLAVTLEGDTVLYRHEQAIAIEIAPGGFETIPLELTATAEGAAALERLSDGELASLAYGLEGTVVSRESGDLAIRREDRLYRVPGRPGEFR